MTNRHRAIAMARTVLITAVVLVGAGLLLLHVARKGTGPAPVERLWNGTAPLANGSGDADVPSVSVFLPARWRSTGTAMVICPGGGYNILMSSYEGDYIARWLNSFGVAAFVLKYRLAPRYHHPAPLLDAARAVRFVRYNGAQFGVSPDRVGIIGFSAGGHLASTLITHFDAGDPSAADPVDRVSSRPDFAILGYPVITLRPPWTHAESAAHLLGPQADPALIDELSNDLHVTADTPPTFLFHTNEDVAVPAENSFLFYLAMRRAGVPGELHIFASGPHGVGLANGVLPAPRVSSVMPWSALAERWLQDHWMRKHPWSYSWIFRI